MPQTIHKKVHEVIRATKTIDENSKFGLEKDPESMSIQEIKKAIKNLEKEMKTAASNLQFERAAELRDQISKLREYLE